MSAASIASPPCSVISSPTWGPTNSTRCNRGSPAPTLPSAATARSASSFSATPGRGASRISTSLGVPKCWTTASSKPSAVSASRTGPRSTISG